MSFFEFVLVIISAFSVGIVKTTSNRFGDFSTVGAAIVLTSIVLMAGVSPVVTVLIGSSLLAVSLLECLFD